MTAGVARSSHAELRMLEPLSGPTRQSPVVELKLPNNKNRYTAGQWVFLCIPRLGLLHWHPFTISSASGDRDFTLHIGAGGRWTNRVAELAMREKRVKVRIMGHQPHDRLRDHMVMHTGHSMQFIAADWQRRKCQADALTECSSALGCTHSSCANMCRSMSRALTARP